MGPPLQALCQTNRNKKGQGKKGQAPALEDGLGLLYEDVEGVDVLLDHAEEVAVLAAELARGLLGGVELLAHRLLVGRGEDEGHVDVEVVAVLDAADELVELVLEVLAARGGHHEVVLEDDGHAVPHHVGREGALGLLEGAGRRLVRHAGRHALIKGPDVPLELAVGLVLVHVREEACRERGVGGVGDEAVDAVREPGVGPLEHVREVPAAVALEPLEVRLDVAGRRAEDVLVVLDGRVRRGGRVGPRALHARVGIGQVGRGVAHGIGPVDLSAAHHLHGGKPCNHGRARRAVYIHAAAGV